MLCLQADLENLIAIPKEEGAAGVVLWGSSNDLSSEDECNHINTYVRNTVGPIAHKYITKEQM